MNQDKLFKFLLCFFSIESCSNQYQETRPNVLIFYADDLGWSDIGCYGSKKNHTPHLDKFAAEGQTFTNAYAPAPICSASRASIMTGKSPARLHFEFVSTEGHDSNEMLLPPKRTLELPLKEITLGEIAKIAGYQTAFFGKWHIAKHNNGYLRWSDTNGPLQQGFDVGSDDFGSHPYEEKNQENIYLPKGIFPEDSLVLKSIDFLKKQQNSKYPFLMFFSSYYVHRPVLPNNSWLIEKYREQLPCANENEILYSVFVETMDYYFGQILRSLETLNLDKNTIVIFTSDNGGDPAYTDNTPLKGNKWTLYEGGIRIPLIIRSPKQFKGGEKELSTPVIQWDIFPTICEMLDQSIPDNIDGVTLLPIILGKETKIKRSDLHWHFPYYHPPKSYDGTRPCSALRSGNFKVIYFYEENRTELYNLENDKGETNDLSLKMPKLTNELKLKLLQKLKDVDARLPIKNPNYHDR